jgi:hypothetical protein
MAKQVGNLRTEMVASTILGELLVDAGDLKAAYELFSGALAIADTIGNRRYRAYILYEFGRALWNDPERHTEAQEVLTQSLAICRETGLSFIGPRTLAALAATGSPTAFALLDEGEAVIGAGCLAHNALWFYRDAIETCLGAAAWERAERYADEFKLYTSAEPLPWADFFIERGRALAALGRGERDGGTTNDLRHLQEQATRLGLRVRMPAGVANVITEDVEP